MEWLHPYGLGQTAVGGELDHLLGYTCFFPDINHNATGGAKPLRSGMTIKAMWVRNGSGTTLTPAYGVLWSTTTGEPGIETGGVGGADVAWAGIVDPYVVGTVAAGNHFWLIRSGPCDVIHDGDDTIVAGDILVTGTVGRVDEFAPSATAESEGHSVVGRCIDTPSANTAGTKFRALVDFRF